MREKSKKLNIKGNFIENIVKDTTEPPPEIIKNGILPKEGICLIGAQPKSFKTMFAFNLSISLAAGQSFYDFGIEKEYNVFYIQSEMAYYTTRDERLKPMLLKERVNVENFEKQFFLSKRMPFNIMKNDNLKVLIDKIKELESDILIFDPLVSFHNKEENSNDEMQTVMETFRKLAAETDVAIILIHHSNKSRDYKSGGDTIRGASSIFGAVDTFIGMKKSSDLVVNMEFDKRYGKPLYDLRFKLNPDTCWLEKVTSTNSNEIRDKFMIDMVSENGYMKSVKLRNEVSKEFDVSIQTATRWIKESVEHGVLITNGKKRNPMLTVSSKN